MKFYNLEDVPQGKRYCTTCRRFFDTDNFVYMSASRGVTFYIDEKTGAAHTLLSERVSANRKRQLYPTKDEESLVIPVVPEGARSPSVENIPSAPLPDNQANGGHTEPSPPEVTKGNEETEPAVTVNDWFPNPEDWFTAEVVTTPHVDYSFARLSNGEDVFIHRTFVQPGWAGHKCLRAGEQVYVRMEPNTDTNNKQNTPWRAIDAAVLLPRESTPDTGTVIEWYATGKGGWVKFPCGCNLKVGSYHPLFVEVGDLLQVSKIKEGPKGWYAPEAVTVLEVEDSGEEI